MRVAVFGASGFVGATMVEHLLGQSDMEVQAFIHNFGNAWRLARAAVPMRAVDITSMSQVSEAVAGCTHVVNCTRGSREVMFAGLKNLLSASVSHKVRRFVHLSSVAVYGDPPARESEREDAPVKVTSGYGADKLLQDEMVAKATVGGLDCVVLCPPNITGVYSSFVTNVLEDMRNGSLVLVDGGSRPNNTVDVENLAHAIKLALQVKKGDGRRIFVSDGTGYTWKDMIEGLLLVAELTAPLVNIQVSALRLPGRPTEKPASLWRSMKHVVSSEVREALRRDPLWAKFDMRLRRLAGWGGTSIEDRLRQSIEGPRKISKVYDENPHSSRYNAMQLRGVWHRIDRARDVLGYEPPLSFDNSMARYRSWYETMHGFGQPYWPLVRTLNAL